MVTHGLNLPRHGTEEARVTRVVPSQGCLPKPQAVALSDWCSLVSFDCTVIAGRVRLRDKLCKAGIHADPLFIGRKPAPSGKERAKAPGGDPGYGQWHAVIDNGGKDLRSQRLRRAPPAVIMIQVG